MLVNNLIDWSVWLIDERMYAQLFGSQICTWLKLKYRINFWGQVVTLLLNYSFIYLFIFLKIRLLETLELVLELLLVENVNVLLFISANEIVI